jgi:DNA-binding response OmpR family regulator
MKQNKPKILLVEDDTNLGFVLNDFMSMSNYEPTLARDGNEGLETFKNGNFDLCILDVMLPFKDGFTLAEEIRKMEPEVPIIFLTAKTMEKDKIKGFKAGGDDYITKPFSTEELSLRIEAILRRSKYSIIKSDSASEFDIGKYKFDYTNYMLYSPQIFFKATSLFTI